MRRLFAILLVGVFPLTLAAKTQKMKYLDAATLPIVNRAQPVTPGFQRLDVERYPDLTQTQSRYLRYSTGKAVVFRTDSRNLCARWTTAEASSKCNAPLIAQRGLDLYIRIDGKWVFAGVGVPSNENRIHEATLVGHMAEGMKECMLYLPLFDELRTLEIGVDDGAVVEAMPNPFRRRIVVIGSSITHGMAASRPGMTWPARLGRSMNLEFINLGTSGVCRLDAALAQIAADTEADAFVFDVFSNPSPRQIDERLEPFVRRIRDRHPSVPLIFLQTEVRETGTFDLRKRKFETEKRAAAQCGMERLMKTDENLVFLDPGMPLGDDHEATVDGVHPTDLGFSRILRRIGPQIERILAQYDIR